MIVPLALVGSWLAVVLQYIVLGVTAQFGVFREFRAWWALLLGVAALWFYMPALQNPDARPVPSEPVAHEAGTAEGA